MRNNCFYYSLNYGRSYTDDIKLA